MPLLIALHGPQRSGKDEIAQILVGQHGFHRIAFADALRAMALDLNPLVDRFDSVTGKVRKTYLADLVAEIGWERAKDVNSEVRTTLQRLATEVVRKWCGGDFWVNVVEQFVQDNPGLDVVIPDLRFANEDQWLASRGGYLWEIHRPGYDFKPGHASEEWAPAADQPNLLHLDNNGSRAELVVTVGAALEITRLECGESTGI